MKKIQKQIETYLKKRNWHECNPADVAKSVSIESAELLELFQWENPDRALLKKDARKMKDIQNEVSDVFIYLFNMAITLGFDAEKALLSKLRDVEKKYPAKKIALGHKEYLKIKKSYRKHKQK